jgi:hypothetical protein
MQASNYFVDNSTSLIRVYFHNHIPDGRPIKRRKNEPKNTRNRIFFVVGLAAVLARQRRQH